MNLRLRTAHTRAREHSRGDARIDAGKEPNKCTASHKDCIRRIDKPNDCAYSHDSFHTRRRVFQGTTARSRVQSNSNLICALVPSVRINCANQSLHRHIPTCLLLLSNLYTTAECLWICVHPPKL